MHLDSDTHKRDSDFSVRKNCCSFYTISIKFIDSSSGNTYNTYMLVSEVIVNQSVEPQKANKSLLPETPILVIWQT